MKFAGLPQLLCCACVLAQEPQEPHIEALQAAVAKWDALRSYEGAPVNELEHQRQVLLKAWEAISPIQRTSAMLREITAVNGFVLSRLVEVGEFKDAERLLVEHQAWCQKESVGLIGRADHALQDFVEAHAKITSAVGSDPLSGKELPYILEKVDGGFRAVVKFRSRGEDRATQVNGDTLQELQPDETLARYLSFDRTGRMTRDVLVGLQFPDDGQSLFERVRSVYLEGTESPAGVVAYTRTDAGEHLRGIAEIDSRRHQRETPASSTKVSEADARESSWPLWVGGAIVFVFVGVAARRLLKARK